MYQFYAYGASVNYSENSLCDEHTYQLYAYGASVNYSGNSLCDNCTCMEAFVSYLFFKRKFSERVTLVPLICFSTKFL